MIFILIILALIPTSFTTIYTDGGYLKEMCCSCRSRGLQCVYCELPVLQGVHACDLRTTSAAFSSWVVVVNTFTANYLSNPVKSSLITTQALSYFMDDGYTLKFAAATVQCNSRVDRYMNCVYGNGAYNVMGCMSTPVDPKNTGMASECTDQTCCCVDNPYFCYAERYVKKVKWSTNVAYYNKVLPDPSYPCYEMDAPGMLTALNKLSETCPTKNTTTASVQNGDVVHLISARTTTLANLYKGFMTRKLTSKRVLQNSYVWSVCTNDTDVVNTLGGLGNSWWSNVLINPRGPCSGYVPFSNTQDICVDDIFGDLYASGCSDTFRTKEVNDIYWSTYVTVPQKPSEPTPPSGNSSTTCESLNEHYDCAYKNWIDYFISSISTGKLNLDLDNYAKLQHDYATERMGQTRDWFTWLYRDLIQLLWDIWQTIFLDCIEPFLEAVIEAVGSVVLAILNTYLDLIKKSQHFIDILVDFITKILDVLLQLCALILKILLGIFLKMEQHFLLFEYAMLFVFINKYFLNNPIVAALLVVVVMVVFGFERRSPSLLLYFYNQQYLYVNLTQYQETRFNWSYTITYHPRPGNDSITVTFPKPGFNNSYELIPLPNRTLTLPPPYDIPPSKVLCAGSYIN